MHSEFSPSQLARIIACPGSVSLYREMNFHQEETEYQREGTLLHEYMYHALLSPDFFFEIEDPEHRRACQDALNHVHDIMSTTDFERKFWREQRVVIKQFPEVFGTADLVIWSPRKNRLHVIDYKFGKNVSVDVEENPQLMAYAIGALDTLAIPHTADVYLHIIQPRLDNYQQIMYSGYYLDVWLTNVLAPAIAAAKTECPPFHPSEKGCRWCQAKAICRARYNEAQEAAQTVFAAFLKTQDGASITPDELAKFYADADKLQSQISAVKDYVLAELLRGRTIPGYRVVHGRANRKWRDEAAAAKWLEQQYNADPMDLYETKFRSPAYIERLFKKAKTDPEFKRLVITPQGAPKVVPDDGTPEDNANPFSSVTEEKK